MYKKVQILLHKTKSTPLDLLEEKISSEINKITSLLPENNSCLSAIRLKDDPIRHIAHSEEIPESAESFDAMFEVGAENGDLSQLAMPLRNIIQELNGYIDSARSAVIAGTEHIILPGQEPLMLILAIRFPAAKTEDAYHDYWLNKHAEVARKVPLLRAYRQFHANEPASRDMGKSLDIGIVDFNGTAQGYYRDVEDFLEIMAQPEVTADAIEDEKNFIDHSRSVMGLFKIIGS
jgi:hypothetical protein